MFNLPTELCIHILSYLPLTSISRLQTVCKSWNHFCNFHEDTIYHNAAYLHAFIPRPTTVFNELGSHHSNRVLEGVKTWKDLCQKRLQIRRNWKGKGPSIIVHHKSTSSERNHLVHRVKVDELAGYIVTTYTEGGLRVTDLNKDRILWALPKLYVRRFAHLEYGQGYIIFDRNNGDMEVWRHLSDITKHVVDESSAPDATQHQVYNLIRDAYPLAMTNGHFQPWAVLHMPESISEFRFVYPTLVVANYNRAYLWDIPSGKLIQTLQGCQFVASEGGYNEYLGRIKYVEISERHVFLVGPFRLRVFSRVTGKSILDLQHSYGFWKYMPISHDRTPGSTLVRHEIVATQEPYEFSQQLLTDKFVSAHVSACGCHFVALLSGCRLLIVYNFEKASNDEVLHDQTLNIQITSSRFYESIYLAYDHGRIALVTTNGVFIVEVDESDLGNISDKAPALTVCRVFQFASQTSLSAVNCLILSDTGLYLNWDPKKLLADEEDEDEDERLEPWWEDDNDDSSNQGEQSHSLSTSVISVNFARSS